MYSMDIEDVTDWQIAALEERVAGYNRAEATRLTEQHNMERDMLMLRDRLSKERLAVRSVSISFPLPAPVQRCAPRGGIPCLLCASQLSLPSLSHATQSRAPCTTSTPRTHGHTWVIATHTG